MAESAFPLVDADALSENHQNKLCKEISDFKNVMEKLQNIQKRFGQLNESEGQLKRSYSHSDPNQIKTSVFQDLPEEIAIAVTGKTNAGKSTIVNELFRYIDSDCYNSCPLNLPTDEIPTTARITRLIYSEQFFERLIDGNGKVVENIVCSNLNFSSCKLEAEDRYDASKVSMVVEIGLPHKLLKSGVTFYDLPGVDENVVINETISNFLINSRSCFVLYVFDGVKGLTDSDRQAIIKLLGIFKNTSNIPNFLFLVNKLDFNVKTAIEDMPNDSENEVDYSSEENYDSTHEDKRRNAIELLYRNDKLSPPREAVKTAICKLQKWKILTECDTEMVFPLSGKVIQRYLNSKRIHHEEDELKDSFKEIIVRLTTLIKCESKERFQIVTTGIVEILVPLYKDLSMNVGKRIVGSRGTDRFELKLYDKLQQLYKDMKNRIKNFEWETAMRQNYVKIEKHLQKYANQYASQICGPLSSDRVCLINYFKDADNFKYQKTLREMINYLCDMCDRICFLTHRKFDSLLKSIKFTDENLAECNNSHVSTIAEKYLFNKCTFETLYFDSFHFKFNKKDIYKDTSNRVLVNFISNNKGDLETLLKKDYPNKNVIGELVHLFINYMASTRWDILLGKDQILSSYLKDAENHFDDSHNGWKIYIERLLKSIKSDVMQEVQPLQALRHRISPLLMEIYAIEYQHREGLKLEDVRDKMQRFSSSHQQLDSNIFIFKPDQLHNPSELKRIDLSSINNEKNRVHRICNHVLKSRWIRELRHEDHTAAASQIHEAVQYLQLVRWWLYDLSTNELFIASDIKTNSLATVLAEKRPSLCQRLHFGRHILLAITLLHKNHMCHGDLRPEIVTISCDGKKALLNLSKIPDPMKKITLYENVEFASFHLAPDRYENVHEDLSLSHYDVFAFGSLLWLLVEGSGKEVPNFCKDADFQTVELLLKAKKWPVKPNPCHDEIDEQIGDQLYEAMKSCWNASHHTDTSEVFIEVHDCIIRAIKSLESSCNNV